VQITPVKFYFLETWRWNNKENKVKKELCWTDGLKVYVNEYSPVSDQNLVKGMAS
jgi:cytochrome c oxidase assembly factor CtaG